MNVAGLHLEKHGRESKHIGYDTIKFACSRQVIYRNSDPKEWVVHAWGSCIRYTTLRERKVTEK